MLFPTIVYAAFVFYGGPGEDPRRKEPSWDGLREDAELLRTKRWGIAELPPGEDHPHCPFCLGCDSMGYTSDGLWLCPRCYERIIASGEDPETVLREAGWK